MILIKNKEKTIINMIDDRIFYKELKIHNIRRTIIRKHHICTYMLITSDELKCDIYDEIDI